MKTIVACSRVLLLIITSSNIVTHSNGCIKGDKRQIQNTEKSYLSQHAISNIL